MLILKFSLQGMVSQMTRQTDNFLVTLYAKLDELDDVSVFEDFTYATESELTSDTIPPRTPSEDRRHRDARLRDCMYSRSTGSQTSLVSQIVRGEQSRSGPFS